MNKRISLSLAGAFLSALLMIGISATVDPAGGHFPFITLNGKTNQISDSGTALTRDGIAIGGGDAIWTNSAGTIQATSTVADGATAVAYKLNTTNNLTTTGATLFNLYDNDVLQLFIEPGGAVFAGPSALADWGSDNPGAAYIAVSDQSVNGATLAEIACEYVDSLVGTQAPFVKMSAENGPKSRLNVNAGDGLNSIIFQSATSSGSTVVIASGGAQTFAVKQSGAISTSTTDEWIFKGLTVDAGVTNAHFNINGTNFHSVFIPD